MIFPVSPRVIYKNNPLELVICQLRFPPVLRIDSQLPVEFQEMISSAYPILQSNTQSAALLPPELNNFLQSGIVDIAKVGYEFASEDGNWILGLTNSFIALSAKNYVRWEEFWQHLEGPIEALKRIYKPAFFTRIGLRYRDVIRKSTLQIDGSIPWSDLLQPHLLGEMNKIDPQYLVKERLVNMLVDLDEHTLDRVRIQHGLATHPEGEGVYLIDNDFFVEQKTETGDERSVLNRLNKNGGNLFRWCITDYLHEAMGPNRVNE